MYSGVSVLAWWAHIEQDWTELDSLSWCDWISGLFVCLWNHIRGGLPESLMFLMVIVQGYTPTIVM